MGRGEPAARQAQDERRRQLDEGEVERARPARVGEAGQGHGQALRHEQQAGEEREDAVVAAVLGDQEESGAQEERRAQSHDERGVVASPNLQVPGDTGRHDGGRHGKPQRHPPSPEPESGRRERRDNRGVHVVSVRGRRRR